MQERVKACIVGSGMYVPDKVLTNAELEKLVETSDEWIVTRTGIKERRIAETDTSADMGYYAAKKALEQASLSVDQIDLIIVATTTPDYIMPGTGTLIQAKLEAKRAGAVDIQAACSGFLYGLSISKAYIESGLYQNILLIATEKVSSFINYKDRNTCIIFGDGACAAVVSNQQKGLAINQACLGSDGTLTDLLLIPAGGSRVPVSSETLSNHKQYLYMEGKEVFKHAVRRMTAVAQECLEKSNLSKDEIRWIVPHQANVRIIEAIAKSLDTDLERVYKTVHKYGNTSASSVGIALDELSREHPFQTGENILLVAFGAGFTWAAVTLTQVG